ncbi:MAG: chromate transporter [Lachnospiraceae bacterium]|nr:chromate transporter [Lachnospiraceae bacterium]
MIYLELLLSFLKIGVVSFGGGYGMISLVRETVVSNGWLTDTQMMDFIAVSESTPGPIAVNMATFVGFSQGGVLGSVLATLGVILPAFLIMLVIASVAGGFMKRKGVNAFLEGVRPGVVALIISTAVTMGLSLFFGVGEEKLHINVFGLILLVVISGIAIGYKKVFKKKISPIVLILISAAIALVANLIFPSVSA